MHQRHEQIAQPEEQAAVAEGGGDCQGDNKEAAHGEQHQEPQKRWSGRHGVGEPGIAAVDPPEVAEDQQDPTQASHGRGTGQQTGELGDGEHENQIEEQLDGRHPDLRRAGPAPSDLVASRAAVVGGRCPDGCLHGRSAGTSQRPPPGDQPGALGLVEQLLNAIVSKGFPWR
jgi:hypothetical protein